VPQTKPQALHQGGRFFDTAMHLPEQYERMPAVRAAITFPVNPAPAKLNSPPSDQLSRFSPFLTRVLQIAGEGAKFIGYIYLSCLA
jgi:hypothetical protein